MKIIQSIFSKTKIFKICSNRKLNGELTKFGVMCLQNRNKVLVIEVVLMLGHPKFPVVAVKDKFFEYLETMKVFRKLSLRQK